MSGSETVAVRLLDPASARDGRLVAQLAALINGVYAMAEAGLWRDGVRRTTPSEMADLIAARQIAVAERGGAVAGAVHVEDVADDTSLFGMLAADPGQRGTGVGTALLAFAEGHSRDRGLRAMQLELLVPRAWRHPSKEFLKGWYGRRGYRRIRTTTLDETYPHLAPLLATPCDLEVHEKPLS